MYLLDISVSSCYHLNMNNEATRQQLIQQAEADLAQYPQYKGKFTGYVLVRVKKDQKTKMGRAFSAGELAIADPNVHFPETGPYTKIAFMTVYSHQNTCDTSVRVRDLEVMA
jgi:hypothetical protein